MSVVDASAVVRLLLRLPGAEAAERYIFEAWPPACAPDLLNVEVLHVLRRYEMRRDLDAPRCAAALLDLTQLPIARYPTIDLLDQAWSFRRNATAYDAVYVALAEALDTVLVTADAKLATATRRHTGVRVVLLD